MIIFVILLMLSHESLGSSRLDGLDEVGLSYGSGELVIYVFASPTCTYCRKFHLDVKDKLVDAGFKVVYLLIAPNNESSANAISREFYCSSEKENVLASFKAHILPGTYEIDNNECGGQILDGINKLASFYNIHGTPTIVLPDDSLVVGVPDVDELIYRYITALSLNNNENTMTNPVKGD